ncbi:MAG: glycosyltransferase family 4 protein [Rhizobiales bacterium]|nr:glycosyltransferase family 4 protein [Hyphomicrobiales bacterium]
MEQHSHTAVPQAGTVALVLKGYPRLSETFIAQEIAGLEKAGLKARIYSMRFPTETARHPVHGEIAAPVTYLPEYLYREPLRVLRAFARVRRYAGYRKARSQFLFDLRRDLTPNRIRRFGQALVLAAEMPPEIGHIHAHFLHTPSSVADYAAIMRGLDWSFSAHAKDIWLTPEWEKRGKLARAAWGVTCTRYGYQHLIDLAPPARRHDVELVYHGLDLDRFPVAKPNPGREQERDGSDPAAPVVIASVGRIVEKKGYDILIDALARLPTDLEWRFIHIGGGKGLNKLKAKARAAGISERLQWQGARAQGEVIGLLRKADIFVLASRIASDGDRDGLPNVLMEAQSQAVACLATNVAAIPELIIDGKTGLMVPPEDADALAGALAHLVREPALRRTLGKAGRERLESEFSAAACLPRLIARFGLAPTKDGTLAAAE